MVGNREIFKADHLLLNMGVNVTELQDISKIPYRELSTGLWYQEAVNFVVQLQNTFY